MYLDSAGQIMSTFPAKEILDNSGKLISKYNGF